MGKKVKVKVEGALPKLQLDMPLNEEQIQAIKQCLGKKRLKITLNKVDIVKGRLGDGWKYD
jgi:hypothetical protein